MLKNLRIKTYLVQDVTLVSHACVSADSVCTEVEIRAFHEVVKVAVKFCSTMPCNGFL